MTDTCVHIILHFTDNEIQNSKDKLNYLSNWIVFLDWIFCLFYFLCVTYVLVNTSQLKALGRKGKSNCWETSRQLLI